MQRLAKADDLIADRQRDVFRGVNNADVQLFEIGLLITPSMIGYGFDACFEELLVIRRQSLARLPAKLQPACGRDIDFADDIRMHPVRREDGHALDPLSALQRDIIVKVTVITGNEVNLSLTNQSRERIGLEAEAVCRGVGMDRIAHFDRLDTIEVDLFQEGKEKRFVSAANAGSHALLLQPSFRLSPAIRVVEGPGFQRLARNGELDNSVQRSSESLV